MEEGVSDDSMSKITGEVELDLTSNLKISRIKVGKGSPLVLFRRITNPVSILVDTNTTRLHISWLFFFSSGGFCLTLSDIVILLGAVNLAPESKS
jgi:hypothetical protein